MSQRPKVLVVDDEQAIREVLKASLQDEGFEVEAVEDGEKALVFLDKFKPTVVLLDIWMPGLFDGLEVLKRARTKGDEADFIVMSGHGTIETAVKATKLGAWDFVEKPLSMDKILILIKNILAYQSERREKQTLLTRLRRDIALVGESGAMIGLKQLISRISASPSWLLIAGEEGVGKELVAQNIHYLSDRAGRPFVELNSRNIPEELFEAEVFGYEAGAFAGPVASKRGLLELAHGGTLFIEHVDQIPLSVQQKLVQFLQVGTFSRVGGTEKIACDVRVIGATTELLERQVAAGQFREDFYHRLNLTPILVPPLRDRKEDLAGLLHHFKAQFEREGGYRSKVFSAAALSFLRSYSWPGNVREFRNFIERVYILTPSDFVDVHDLHFAGLVPESNVSGAGEDHLTFREARARFEKEFLQKKIVENQGNISKTAETIGLERSYLHRKIKAYGIDV